MQISSGGKSLLCPSKWVQRGPNKVASPCPFTIQAAPSTSARYQNSQILRNIRHYVGNASLMPREEAVPERTNAGGDNSMKRGSVEGKKERKKVNFLLFSLFAWGGMFVKERKTEAMVELLHPAYYSAALALCPQAFLRLTILTTPVICGPVILPIYSAFLSQLTRTVNWACLSCWWGLGQQQGQILTRVNGKSGTGKGGSYFCRKGCNELAAAQGYRNGSTLHCGASISRAADREGKRCNDTKHPTTTTPPAFKSLCLFLLSLPPQSNHFKALFPVSHKILWVLAVICLKPPC